MTPFCIYGLSIIKWKQKQKQKYHTVGTVPKSIRKIVRNKGKIDTANKYMIAHYPGLIQALQ
jgi:hypothetical protein